MPTSGFGSTAFSAVPENFEALLESCDEQAYRLAYLVTGNDEQAERVLKTVFTAACEQFQRGTVTQDDIMTWIFAQIVESAIAKVESARLSIERLTVLASKDTDIDQPEISRGMSDELRAALAELPVEEQRAFLLHDVLGVSVESIAEVIGFPKNRIRHLLYRARTLLRKLMRRTDDGLSIPSAPGKRPHAPRNTVTQ